MNNHLDDIRDRLREGESRESELEAKLSNAVKESAARISVRVARAIAAKTKQGPKLPQNA